VRTGRADLHAGLLRSAERAASLDFTAAFLSIPVRLYYPAAEGEAPRLEDLAGARIGVLGADASAAAAHAPEHAELTAFGDLETLLEAVEAGRLDAFVAPAPMAELVLLQSGKRGRFGALPEPVGRWPIRAAVAKDNAALLTELQRGLDAISAHELNAVAARWIPGGVTEELELPAPPPLALSAEEQAWIAAHPVVRVAPDPHFPPLEMVAEDGGYRGLVADYLELIAERTGLHFEAVATADLGDALAKVRDGEAEMLGLDVPDAENTRYLRFTELFVDFPSLLLTRQDQRDARLTEGWLAGRRVAVPAGYPEERFLRENYPRARIVAVQGLAEGLRKASLGEVDAVVAYLPSASWLLEREGMVNLRAVGELPMDGRAGMAVRKDLTVLHGILQKGLAAVTEAERRAIRQRWMGLESSRPRLELSRAERAFLAQHPTVTLGVASAWPPFDFADENGRHKGITADYLALLERRLGVRFTAAVDQPWAATVARAREGGLDGLGGIVRTPERERHFLFTAPYFAAPYVIFTRRDGPVVHGLDDLKGRRVAVEDGYYLHERLRSEYPHIRLLVVPTTLDALQAVVQGRADAYVGNQVAATWQIHDAFLDDLRVAAPTGFGRGRLRLALRKDWPLLVSAVNKALDSIEMAEHQAIRRRWLPPQTAAELAPLRLTPAEKAWLRGHPRLRVGIDPAWPPIEFFDEEGRHRGITADVLARLEDLLDVHLEVLPDLSWSAVLERARAGELEVVAAVTRSPERDSYLDFTTPYLHFPFVVFTRDDAPFVGGPDELLGKRVAVERDYVIHEHLRRDQPHLDLVPFPTAEASLEALSLGRVDAYVGNLAAAGYVIDRLGLANLKVAGPTPYGNDLAMGVRKGMPHLVAILQKALDHIPPQEQAAIRQKWLGLRYEVGVDYTLVRRVLAAALTVIALGALWLVQVQRRRRALARAKAEAERANRFKSRFLANMSHEIRTPMNAIVGFAHLALQSGLAGRQRDYVEKIQASAHALLGVINDILDFSRIEAGRLEVERTAFSLDEVLENLANLHVMRAEEQGLELLFRRDLKVPDALLGDPLRLGQVLNNLVGNAIKFTERGEVTVSVRLLERSERQARVEVAVRDTGIGIAPEQLPRLFQPFTQVDESTTRRHGGSGLGLSICRHLVELMGGRMTVDSRPGRGSAFTCVLPFGVVPGQARRPLEPEPDLRGLRVLVVDDNPAARQVLRDLLASFTFRPQTAASAAEAWALLERADGAGQPFQLVLMDWRMPGLDGIEAGRRIKQSTALGAIPAVLIVTAYGREEVMRQAEAAGLDGFLLKPVSPSVLFDSVVQALGGRPRGVTRPHAATEPLPPRRLAGNVLLVEDNLINRQLAQELLERMGLLVRTAGDGRQALAALGDARFDLVLMDIQMPEMDGFEATAAIRAQPRLAGLPIVAMTAHAMAGDRERCLAAGMNDHIAKPIDPERLLRTLAQWLRPAAGRAPAPADTDRAPLPATLPGVDLAWGLQRVGGNRRLFRKLLGDFVVHHGEAPQALRRHLAAGDLETALREVHTLHGVAGNLGARGLEGAAGRLEAALRGGEAVTALPDDFTRAFAELLQGLQGLEVGRHTDRAAQSAGAHEPVEDLIGALDALLAEGDPEAAQLAARLAARVTDAPLEDGLKKIRDTIDNYDFDDARATLAELKRTLAQARGLAADGGGRT
jgi:ABC-type amino acid transport substrate-binding protein/DNA-binding response OmpR family regulator/anti-sigma regulatory factor (Ser/Thr protein kinase)